MPVGNFVERLLVGGIAVVAALLCARVELQFFVQDNSDLARGGEVEGGLAGHLAGLLLNLDQFFRQDTAVVSQHPRVDPYAIGFHLGQDADQRHLDPGVKFPEMLFLQLLPQQGFDQPGRHAFPAA